MFVLLRFKFVKKKNVYLFLKTEDADIININVF